MWKFNILISLLFVYFHFHLKQWKTNCFSQKKNGRGVSSDASLSDPSAQETVCNCPPLPGCPCTYRTRHLKRRFKSHLRKHNGGAFGEGTKLFRRIRLSPLDTMGPAAFSGLKQVLLHTRASTEEGGTMGSGSCPGDHIFPPGWVFECVLLPHTAREWRCFSEYT